MTTTLASRLDALVQSNPRAAVDTARRALDSGVSDIDAAAAWTSMGRALYELGDMQRAPMVMRKALTAAEAAGDARQLQNTRMSAAAIFAERGDTTTALELLAAAEAAATGAQLGRVLTQQAFVLHHVGRHAAALDTIDRAEQQLTRSRDHLGRLRLLVNKALILLQIGELDRAEHELVRARRLAVRLNQRLITAGITQNMAVVRARRGELAHALRTFDEASTLYAETGHPSRVMAVLEIDRAEALERSGLWEAALDAAEQSRQHALASGNAVALGDAELALATAQLAAGRLVAAQSTAKRAASQMSGAGRPEWALLARACALNAALRAAPSPSATLRLLDRARRVARRLADAGAIDVAHELDGARWQAAYLHDLLHLVVDEPSLPHDERFELRTTHKAVLRSLHDTDHHETISSALAVALPRRRPGGDDSHGQRRARAAVINDLANIGVRDALERGDGVDALRWAAVSAADPRRLMRLTARSLTASAGASTVVRYLRDGSDVWAVVARRGDTTVANCGRLSAAVNASERLTSWLHRVHGEGAVASVDDAARIAAELDRLLIQPLGIASAGSIMIVPCAELADVVWGSLPVLSCRSLSVNYDMPIVTPRPSTDQRDAVGAAIAPAIRSSRRERAAVADHYDRPKVVTGQRATPRAVLSLLSTHRVVHIAAHGDVHLTRPGMSGLAVAGGVLSLVDLADHPPTAEIVVLSSCSAGSASARRGAISGFAHALIQHGVRCVIAPLTPVAERDCAQFGYQVHAQLASGRSASDAVAAVRSQWLESANVHKWSTAAAFAVIGDGRASITS